MMGLLVDSEWMSRQNAHLKRNLKEARLKLGSACLEDLDYDERRELDKPLIRQLATCNWVTQHRTSPSPARPAPASPSSPAPSPSTPSAVATAPSTAAPRGSSTSSRSPAPTGPMRDCWSSSPASTS